MLRERIDQCGRSEALDSRLKHAQVVVRNRQLSFAAVDRQSQIQRLDAVHLVVEQVGDAPAHVATYTLPFRDVREDIEFLEVDFFHFSLI